MHKNSILYYLCNVDGHKIDKYYKLHLKRKPKIINKGNNKLMNIFQ